MSVLKEKRSQSKIEYVNTANEIYVKTIAFLSRLSSRYSRLIASDIAKLAGDILDNAEMACNVFPSDELRYNIRKEYLLKSRASVRALDVRLSHCYSILMTNPEGCFTTSNGNKVKSDDAIRKLDNMSVDLGCLIDTEYSLLTSILNSDRDKFKSRTHS